ncbi:hypothetical protein DINM_006198 [Dirofilaria immitis]|nr:hypothetical protein [Dirofilaria immitis]
MKDLEASVLPTYQKLLHTAVSYCLIRSRSSLHSVTRGISEVVRLRSLACFVVKLSWCFREVRPIIVIRTGSNSNNDGLFGELHGFNMSTKSARTTMSSKSLNMPLNLLKESHLTRLAGFSGALAISLGAYGAHALRESGNTDERRTRAFETGNRYHLIHSVTLFFANKARFPWLTVSLLLSGMAIFSGSCYHYSITGKDCLRKYTPIGGVMYILAWLSFLL